MHSELFLIDPQGVLEYIALRSERGDKGYRKVKRNLKTTNTNQVRTDQIEIAF